MAAAAVLEPIPYGDKLSSTNSKDWFTQTDITKQDSTDVMTQYENQRFLWDDMDKLDVQSCDSESQTDLRCSFPNMVSMDISTQIGIIAADSSTQHNVNVTDSATQNNAFTFEESLPDGGVEVGVQIQQILSDKETQEEVKVVDAGVQHGTLVSFEDKEISTESEMEKTASKNYVDVFIQAVVNDLGVSKSCQCFTIGANPNATSEQAVQTHEALSTLSVEVQAVRESADVTIQNHQIVSSMRTQTESTIVCDQSIQTVFSPYTRQLNVCNEDSPEKMEVFTQTQPEEVEQIDPALNQNHNVKIKVETKEEKSQFKDSSSQCDSLSVQAIDAQTNTTFPTEHSIAKTYHDVSTSHESLTNTQYSMTQYEENISDSSTMTLFEESSKTDSSESANQALLLVDSFTQYECSTGTSVTTTMTLDSLDKMTQYENHILDVMTQYDLIDFSDIPKEEYESTGAHTTNPEGSVSASISATTIRDNLAQEEMNNSKYSSLRGRVEDCLQNWQWYQSEKNEPDPDQKSEAEFYIEEFPNTKVENMPPNEFPLEKDSAGVCSQVQIDKHSFGDAVFASVRGKRSKRPGGSRKFCIIM